MVLKGELSLEFFPAGSSAEQKNCAPVATQAVIALLRRRAILVLRNKLHMQVLLFFP